MKLALGLLPLSFIISCHAITWEQLIEEKQAIMGPKVYELIKKQYGAYISNQVPKIADPVIREIPIESNESDEAKRLIDIRNSGDFHSVTMLPSPNQPYLSPDYNAGTTYAPYMRSQMYEALKNMEYELSELSHDFGYKLSQVSIKIFECLRDFNMQKKLFEQKVQQIQLRYPTMSLQDAYAEAATWIAPVDNNTPVHCTGCAAAIRLWNNTYNKPIDLGQFGDIWEENSTAPTFSEEITDHQKKNRLYALIAASRAGLVNYPNEHWLFFSSQERYACYWQAHQQKAAGIICPEAINSN